jgi:hypothetical protein
VQAHRDAKAEKPPFVIFVIAPCVMSLSPFRPWNLLYQTEG